MLNRVDAVPAVVDAGVEKAGVELAIPMLVVYSGRCVGTKQSFGCRNVESLCMFPGQILGKAHRQISASDAADFADFAA